MTKEQVIISTINIHRKAERKHFQIILPKDTQHIIGVEYGGRKINVPDIIVPPEKPDTTIEGDVTLPANNLFRRNEIIGELKLQCCGKANWFYANDVFWSDANLGYNDFSKAGFSVNDFSHGNKRMEDTINVKPDSNILYGWYADIIGTVLQADIVYEVKIYVWFNTEE